MINGVRYEIRNITILEGELGGRLRWTVVYGGVTVLEEETSWYTRVEREVPRDSEASPFALWPEICLEWVQGSLGKFSQEAKAHC
jgi:hypothetical protein